MVLPKATLVPAFLAGFILVLIMQRPGMVNLPAFFTSAVASAANSPSTFVHSAFLRPVLVAKAMSYAERKAAREAEISGLKEALSILEGPMLLQ